MSRMTDFYSKRPEQRPGSELAQRELARAERVATTTGWVYLIAGGDLHKIGHAIDVRKRIAAMRTGSPVPLRIVAVGGGGECAEERLHHQFGHAHSHGEWFRLSSVQVDTCIELMNGTRMPSDDEETLRILESLHKPNQGVRRKALESAEHGICAYCSEPLMASDRVRWIESEPYHELPCWGTRRKQIQRAKQRRNQWVQNTRNGLSQLSEVSHPLH